MFRCWLFGHRKAVEWLKNKASWDGWFWDWPYYYCDRCFESDDQHWNPDYDKWRRNLWHRTIPFWIFRWKNQRIAKRFEREWNDPKRIEAHLEKLNNYRYE